MEDMVVAVHAACQGGQPFALVSLVASSGSVPMSDRSRLVVWADGRTCGTIGGGCLEAELVAVAQQVLHQQLAVLYEQTLTEEQAGAGGLNCGGTVRVYVEPIDPQADGPVFAAAAAAWQARRACVSAVRIEPQTQRRPRPRLVLDADGRQWGSLGDPTLDSRLRAQLSSWDQSDEPRLVHLDLTAAEPSTHAVSADNVLDGTVFVEPQLPPPVLYVFGGGHIGGHLVPLARSVGFRVVLADDRPQFANADRHPGAHQWLVGEPAKLIPQLPIDAHSYIVAVTRGHQFDEPVIEHAIRTPARYIGMIGSERKKLLLWERLRARGADPDRLDRVAAPIGINIAADTPAEIAVSIVAELILARRGPPRPWRTRETRAL
jgi:xanthine dehydrogenase accessory factor